MVLKISSGSEAINGLLEGGFDSGVINCVYGPAGSGKSCIALLAALNIAKNKKVIFVDTESGVSADRMKQLESDDSVYKNILFFKPSNFNEQKRVFEKLKNLVDDKVGMIVVDTIGMLYRLELAKSGDVFNVNRDLGIQLNLLADIAAKKNIPILITNQVYSNFDEKGVNMVGGDFLKYGSKVLIELQKEEDRTMLLRKHRSVKENKIKFKIIKEGIIAQ